MYTIRERRLSTREDSDIRASIEIENYAALIKLCGVRDKNLSLIRERLRVSITISENSVVIFGDEDNVNMAKRAILILINYETTDEYIDSERVCYVLDNIMDSETVDLNGFRTIVAIDGKGQQIKCKTAGQLKYYEALENKTVTFGIGPAGTGKTFLAVAYASRLLKNHKIDKIVLTRPAVEAGEKLGFLPGDLQEKVDPYLRPLYDALGQLFGEEQYIKLIDRGVIEVAPLAYMRGRTLANAFIILDEAQNTTIEQMKMFLTRMGDNSRIAVNGDLTQIDLPKGTVSGLRHAARILEGINDIAIVRFGLRDIVRNSLVAEILRAYEGKDLPDGETNAKKDNDDE